MAGGKREEDLLGGVGNVVVRRQLRPAVSGTSVCIWEGGGGGETCKEFIDPEQYIFLAAGKGMEGK